MKLVINNIRLSLDDDIEKLKYVAAKKLNLSTDQIKDFKIVKQSIDARRKPSIAFVYSVMIEVRQPIKKTYDADVRIVEDSQRHDLVFGNIKLNNRPIIIGTGPAGLFAGLFLSQNGYRPILLERGECVERRSVAVDGYWKTGKLDPDSNVQFGEGGAGTFSDGKLTTRINDRRCDYILSEFHKLGASGEILIKAKPHIGSDVLKSVLINMRNKIEGLGGEFNFRSKVTKLKIRDGRITGVVVNESEEFDADVVILAVGHSARDTYRTLFDQGVQFVQKPFSIGVRIEHPQELINRAQYGNAAEHPKLGAADYQIFYKTGTRTVYSFCMCPGGLVVASASEPYSIVTNGMSEFARNRENANSALVVSVGPEDFESSHPLAGIDFQRRWERLAYNVAGNDNSAPLQRLEDFINGTATKTLGTVKPSYTGKVQLSDINCCLPDFVTNAMKESIPYLNRSLKGFAMADALLTGVETRTSSPVRIPRGESFEALGIRGLYPVGEGAGYAGGIVSAAADGLRIAEQIAQTYSQP